MNFLDKYKIKINNTKLLEAALTHSSYSNEHANVLNYERLEYLGDAVLELIISDYFYNNSDLAEGDMTKLRASYVCEKALATYAKNDVGFIPDIKVGNGQQGNINDTIIADIFESILAAIYLEKGLNVAKDYIYKIIVPYIERGYEFFDDYKTKLQELVQTDRNSLVYELVKESGEPHNKKFEVVVKINNIIYGRGIGKSKKEAEQNAAYNAYQKSAK